MDRLVVPGRRDSRLSTALRWLSGVMGVLVLAANTVILLSDRAPGLFRRLSARLDASSLQPVSAQVPPGGRLPETDFMIHVALWALATVLVALAMGPVWSKAMAAGTVLAYSAALAEALQRHTDAAATAWARASPASGEIQAGTAAPS